MTKIIKYTGKQTFMFPSGAIATPEVVAEQYPATSVFTHIVETDANCEVMFALQNLSAMRNMYNIDVNLTEDEAIAAIEKIRNTPAEVVDEITAEERIAAALEAQVMLQMPDVENDTTTESEVNT